MFRNFLKRFKKKKVEKEDSKNDDTLDGVKSLPYEGTTEDEEALPSPSGQLAGPSTKTRKPTETPVAPKTTVNNVVEANLSKTNVGTKTKKKHVKNSGIYLEKEAKLQRRRSGVL
ncbi:unnamed protein product [Bursaphelenchus okinawaensis]|uniref:Uncharacterized protein n=1 Tax=Bursaphelenchus okinawaensis TaxID=465554 RepID=A0A811LUJ4_9BILA|nr:unnamed protein product [Bursaphelenchus okinawaensis]CAG9127894.1 unnamed protein product [Bursaphelenchus okinawaensis]